VGRIEIVVTR